jgi:hypothetical protein
LPKALDLILNTHTQKERGQRGLEVEMPSVPSGDKYFQKTEIRVIVK